MQHSEPHEQRQLIVSEAIGANKSGTTVAVADLTTGHRHRLQPHADALHGDKAHTTAQQRDKSRASNPSNSKVSGGLFVRPLNAKGVQHLRELDTKLDAFRRKAVELENGKSASRAAVPIIADGTVPTTPTADIVSRKSTAATAVDSAVHDKPNGRASIAPQPRANIKSVAAIAVSASSPVNSSRVHAVSAASSPTAHFLGAVPVELKQRATKASSGNAGSGVVTGANHHDFPLENSWTIFADRRMHSSRNASGAAYENNLATLCSVRTVKRFWSYFNQLKAPSQMGNNSNVHIFKSDIKPMWEDPANAQGGKWTIDFHDCPQLADSCWLETVMAAIGEGLDDTNELCGIVYSRRARGDKLSVWVRSGVETDVIFKIGLRLLTLLDLFDEKITMDFRYHSDSMKSGSSYGNHSRRLQLNLESLRSSNEALKKESQRRQLNRSKT